MNNIVESYLMFKANNICDYINILAEEIRKVSKIPKQLNKLIYKYYDLFVLSNKNIDYELLKKKTGLLNESDERLIIFYLLIEFDMASMKEYKDDEYYKFYNFIVNSIIIFSKIENIIVGSKKKTYDELISLVLKDNIENVSNEYIMLLDKLYNSLKKKYNDSLKREIKLSENYSSQNFMVTYTKVKRSSELYFERLKYKNEKLLNESRKDVVLVDKEFGYEFNMINLEMTFMRIFRDTINGIDRYIFVMIDDEVITKKSNFDVFVSLVRLRFLKERVIFLVNTSLLEKYEERVNSLILDDFKISYYKNSNLTSYDVYKFGGYLLVDYDEMESGMKFCQESNLEIIINKVNKKDIDKLNNIKYIM